MFWSGQPVAVMPDLKNWISSIYGENSVSQWQGRKRRRRRNNLLFLPFLGPWNTVYRTPHANWILEVQSWVTLFSFACWMWNTELKGPGFGIRNRMQVKGMVQVLPLPHSSGSPLPPGFSCIVLAFPNKNMTGGCAKVWQDIRCPDLKLCGKRGGGNGESWGDIFTQLQRGLRQIAASSTLQL